jgi:hypothetical protein
MIISNRKKSPYSPRYVKRWKADTHTPISGQYSKTVRDLGFSYLQEINNCDRDLLKYRVMHKKDPTARSCIELKCLRGSLLFGDYTHPDPKTETWVKGNLDNINGSFRRIVGRLVGACAEGFKVAEIIFCNKLSGYKGEWRLKGFNILDSSKVSFEGKDGEIEYVIYVDANGSDIRIPYWKCIHIVNGYGTLSNDVDSVYGDPESRVAYPYFKAKQTLLTEMMVAAKSNAMGIWLGQADSNVSVEMVRPDGTVVTNSDGSPKTESAVTSLLRAMKNIENNSIIVTDKNNTVTPLSVQTSEGFWNMGIEMLDKAIRRAYGVPDMIFSEGSSAIQFGNVAKQHMSTLDSQIASLINQIQDQMIEKVVRTLLVFNKGIKTEFGEFKYTAELDPEQSSLRINNLSMLINTQVVSASNLKVQNALLELVGLDSMTEEEQQANFMKKLLTDFYSNEIMMGNGIPGVTPKPGGYNLPEYQPTEQQPDSAESGQESPQEEPAPEEGDQTPGS